MCIRKCQKAYIVTILLLRQNYRLYRKSPNILEMIEKIWRLLTGAVNFSAIKVEIEKSKPIVSKVNDFVTIPENFIEIC
jgi:hypothetical protein